MLEKLKNTTYEYNDKRYVRNGKCNRCGECCKIPNCPKADYTKEQVKCNLWSKLDYKKDNKEVFKKAGIHTSKCRDFPNSPADLFNDPEMAKKCGFWFEEIWQIQE